MARKPQDVEAMVQGSYEFGGFGSIPHDNFDKLDNVRHLQLLTERDLGYKKLFFCNPRIQT